jgi:hypothetical protein
MKARVMVDEVSIVSSARSRMYGDDDHHARFPYRTPPCCKEKGSLYLLRYFAESEA